MAYNELVKDFNRIRDYMREFYVYGFKSRDEFTKKSARSYDDERRRVESWLGDYMKFRQTPEGKNVFISIDSRVTNHNPLYAAWKTKSFTDGEITLHFLLMDILSSPSECLPLSRITVLIDEYFRNFSGARMFDESTVRKKLKEYEAEGIIQAEKRGKIIYYRRREMQKISDTDALDFFSEVAPCGVIGSFILDKADPHNNIFVFKHHYITGALDSEILCSLFEAVDEKRSITLETINRHKERISESHIVPLRIMISVQNGRQYLMAYVPRYKSINSFRTDNIISVKTDEVSEGFDKLRDRLNAMMPHMWGVSTHSWSNQRLEHVEFTVRYDDDEKYIARRLEREKRCGTVEQLDGNTIRFSADVYDSSEMIPWIRTFICRIIQLNLSNKELEAEFWNDINRMYRLYGLEGGESE
jgi:hypothetical protein